MANLKLPHKFSLWESPKKFFSGITCKPTDYSANFQQFKINSVEKTNQAVAKLSFRKIILILRGETVHEWKRCKTTTICSTKERKLYSSILSLL